ncbi:trypsin-like serine protease, partial [Coemansia reversa NRRL 1564]
IVLTAGHCIVDTSSTDLYDKSSFTVKFTHISEDDKAEAYAVSKVIPHPEFDLNTLKNDIALLILEDKVPDNVASVIKIYNDKVNNDALITAAGFGLTDPKNSSSIATDLMAVDLKLGTDDYCKGIYGNYNSKYLLCTDGTAGKDTCGGDSGGPL